MIYTYEGVITSPTAMTVTTDEADIISMRRYVVICGSKESRFSFFL